MPASNALRQVLEPYRHRPKSQSYGSVRCRFLLSSRGIVVLDSGGGSRGSQRLGRPSSANLEKQLTGPVFPGRGSSAAACPLQDARRRPGSTMHFLITSRYLPRCICRSCIGHRQGCCWMESWCCSAMQCRWARYVGLGTVAEHLWAPLTLLCH